MSAVDVGSVIIDESIYPRASVDPETVARYADALAEGAVFPAIVLETGTKRLLDGRHRLGAHMLLGLADIDAEHHEVPAGLTPKLYAAALQSSHGLPLAESDARSLARELYAAGGDVTATAVAKALGRSRRTVDGWVTDLAESRQQAEAHAREVRRCLALLLVGLGWTQQRVADQLGVSRPGITQLVSNGESALTSELDERVLRDAAASAPADVAEAVEALAQQWREERIFARWSDSERSLLKRLRSGETVVVNMRAEADARFWTWAEQAGLAVRIDRKSIWGNPFILPDDGTRDAVCDAYADAYWPLKPSLHKQIASLDGKALGCWCAPARCHGDFLAEQAQP